MGGVVGELAIADAMLGDLLIEILKTLSEHAGIELALADVEKVTTGQGANELLRIAKAESALFSTDAVNWLKAIVQAAEARNRVMHAVARDYCVDCGRSTRYSFRGIEVDRSPEAVRHVTQTFVGVRNDGVRLAADISGRINARLLTEAAGRMALTGEPQYPTQVGIGQTRYRCASCTGTGTGHLMLTMPAAAALMPPGHFAATFGAEGTDPDPIEPDGQVPT